MIRAIILSFVMGVSAAATAAVPVVFRSSAKSAQAEQILTAQLQSHFGREELRQIRVQVLRPTYLIARLFSAHFHRFENVKVSFDRQFHITTIVRRYILREHPAVTPVCPDNSVQFISFAPNNNDFEQGIARDVANAAIKKGLKTVLLLGSEATRAAYLNYMSCPNLLGNFYDGDSNPEEMITADDSITATDYSTLLKGAFRYRVTNIWLACEAFNDPMLSAVKDIAQAQKYAAGINDLQVGPSDQTGACAMEAGINGQPLTAAFQACYKQYDNSSDHWGFDGSGSDEFGQAPN